MVRLSGDLDIGVDFVNLTFSWPQGAPKVKPAWKVRTAPKLPPKPKALPASSTGRPPVRPKINATRTQNLSSEKITPRITDVTETEEAPQAETAKSSAINKALKPASGNAKKSIPKLKDTGVAKAKAAPSPTKAKVNGVQ
jgi:hypothetical protein